MNVSARRRIWLAIAGIALIALAALAAVKFLAPAADVGNGLRRVHEEPSRFDTVVVYDRQGERCMSFGTMDATGRQTCFRLAEPDTMVFEYTRMMASALLAQPAPERILIIGLGGGTLPTALARVVPGAVIDSVEIDPAVVKVAQRYFGYEPGPRQRVFVQDGREFVERAHREGATYDMVMLDAFDIDYIPAHLLTVEFMEQVKGILSNRGVLVANSFAQSRMYDRESATYGAVFGPFFNLRGRLDGNRVIVAVPSGLPPKEVLEQNARALAQPLAAFGIDVAAELERYPGVQDWPDEAKPLRD